MKRMIRVLMCVGVAVALGATTAAQGAPAAQDLSGKWTMKVSGGPHGDAAMGLVLKQEGETVAATFNPGHDGDIPMSGTCVKGALTLVSPNDDQGSHITMKATIKADGSLSGFLSSAMGDMTWTAARDKRK